MRNKGRQSLGGRGPQGVAGGFDLSHVIVKIYEHETGIAGVLVRGNPYDLPLSGRDVIITGSSVAGYNGTATTSSSASYDASQGGWVFTLNEITDPYTADAVGGTWRPA